jgi:hypothetical protein
VSMMTGAGVLVEAAVLASCPRSVRQGAEAVGCLLTLDKRILGSCGLRSLSVEDEPNVLPIGVVRSYLCHFFSFLAPRW